MTRAKRLIFEKSQPRCSCSRYMINSDWPRDPYSLLIHVPRNVGCHPRRVLQRVGGSLNDELSTRAYDAVARLRYKRGEAMKGCSQCEISTRCEAFSEPLDRVHCLICRGCRFM